MQEKICRKEKGLGLEAGNQVYVFRTSFLLLSQHLLPSGFLLAKTLLWADMLRDVLA